MKLPRRKICIGCHRALPARDFYLVMGGRYLDSRCRRCANNVRVLRKKGVLDPY